MLLIALIKNPDDEKRLQLLHQIAAETPLYPEFKHVRTSAGAKSTSAVVSVWYQVPAFSTTFELVKNFYVQELPAKGWSSPQEASFNRILGGEARELSFHKGEYKLSIFWDDASPNEYSISFSWWKP
jgi:hypothetical protein